MAPSSNYTLIAFLVAFAVVAPSLLHQSAATRDGGAAKAAVAAPAPSSANGSEVVVHPTDTTIEIPDLPLPRFLPCPPVFPKIPFIPCYNTTPPPPPPPLPPPAQPKECRSSLMKMIPVCSGFLTSSSSAIPSHECCDSAQLFFRGGDGSIVTSFCICHILNGDANKFLKTPADHGRWLYLVKDCMADSNMWTRMCNDDYGKGMTPPIDLPKPPTPAPGNKA